MRHFLIACLSLAIPSAVLADVTYTYTGPNFSTAVPPYDTSMRVSGSFTVPDFLDDTILIAPIVPDSYSFSDGVRTLDETNSSITIRVGVGVAGGVFQYWSVGVTTGPRESNTDFAAYEYINTGSTDSDVDRARQEYCWEDRTDICLEIRQGASTRPVNDGLGSWSVSGTGLPDGTFTVVEYTGLGLEVLGGVDPFYTTSNKVTGTVQIAGLVTPQARYKDGSDDVDFTGDIEHFEFSDGINTLDERNSRGCAEHGFRRVSVTFDDDRNVSSWQICLTDDSPDGSFKMEYGYVRTTRPKDSGTKYICDEYDADADRCVLSMDRTGNASNFGMPGSWSTTLPPLSGEPEVCDNNIDDDGDGLIDAADPDCAPPPIGLQVRCMHTPIYPMAGEEVTISAQGIDKNGDIVLADTLEIYTAGDMTTPFKSADSSGGGISILLAELTPGADFSYGCRAVEATETAQSWWLADPKLRSVDVGGANNPDWEAQPVLYNGPVTEKIDIVFFHDATDYTSYVDPAFITAVGNLVQGGLWSIPWFVEHQYMFNIWIARANGADASPKPGPPKPPSTQVSCNRTNTDEVQNIFNRKYKFRDAGGIVHSRTCRDNAFFPRVFTVQANTPDVLPHEMGHRPFGMADEYCNVLSSPTACSGDGGYGQNNPFSNVYRTENGCRNGADDMPYEADACRSIIGKNGAAWWIGEPNYSPPTPNRFTNEIRDLMQQTGFRESVPGNGNWMLNYAVGLSEINRMNWFLEKCIEGKCGHRVR